VRVSNASIHACYDTQMSRLPIEAAFVVLTSGAFGHNQSFARMSENDRCC